MVIKAAAYLRISKDDEGQGLGIDRQHEAVKILCEHKGWVLDPLWVIAENNRSAWDDSKPRPGFQRLIRGMESGEVTAVAVYAFDRLARRLKDTALVLDLVEKHRVQVATVTGGLDLSTIYGRGIAGMLGSMAAMEIAALRERLSSKAEQNVRVGKVHNGGRRPFGYALDRKTVVDEEADVIRGMAQHLLSGGSLSSIAGDLNRRGRGTAYGTTWSTRKVKDVLDNPRLCGRVVHRGEVRPNIRGQWGTILDEDTFDAVQLAMAARRRVENSWTNRRQHLLSGSLLRCGVCDGKTLAFLQSSGVWAYRCRGHVLRNEANVDEHIRRAVTERASEHPFRVTEWETAQEGDISEEIAVLERRRADAVRAFAEHGGDAAALAMLTAQVQAQIDGLRSRQVERVVLGIDAEAAQFDVSDLLASTATTTEEIDQQRAVIRLYVQTIRLHPSKKRGRGYDDTATEIVFRDPDQLAFRAVVER